MPALGEGEERYEASNVSALIRCADRLAGVPSASAGLCRRAGGFGEDGFAPVWWLVYSAERESSWCATSRLDSALAGKGQLQLGIGQVR